MDTDVLERLLRKMKENGLNPRSLSLAAGLNQTFIRDLVRRPTTSPSVDSMQKLAAALGMAPGWLISEAPEGNARSTRLPHEEVMGNLVAASYGGLVEAGTYRPVADDEDDPSREPLLYPRDPQFPQADLFVFDVAGDSMNALAERPIRQGDRLLCIAIEKTRIALRTGMVVIVEQVINGGLLRERSVKQLEVYEDRFEFCPRSKNPRHKPIVVPKDFKVDDGRTVAVIAIVRDIVTRLSLG